MLRLRGEDRANAMLKHDEVALAAAPFSLLAKTSVILVASYELNEINGVANGANGRLRRSGQVRVALR